MISAVIAPLGKGDEVISCRQRKPEFDANDIDYEAATGLQVLFNGVGTWVPRRGRSRSHLYWYGCDMKSCAALRSWAISEFTITGCRLWGKRGSARAGAWLLCLFRFCSLLVTKYFWFQLESIGSERQVRSFSRKMRVNFNILVVNFFDLIARFCEILEQEVGKITRYACWKCNSASFCTGALSDGLLERSLKQLSFAHVSDGKIASVHPCITPRVKIPKFWR